VDTRTWIVLADAATARVYEPRADRRDWKLVAELTHPQARAKESELGRDKPGRVKQVIDIPFAYPRPELPELRGDLQFQRIRATIWSLIRSSEAAHAGKAGPFGTPKNANEAARN